MSNGISGYGTTLKDGSNGDIAEIISISLDGMEANAIDVSTIGSANNAREFIAGMIDAGAVTLELQYEASNHDLLQDKLGGTNENFTITLPDGSTFVFNGFVQSLGLEIPMDDKISQSCSMKISGLPTFTAASAA